MIVQQVNRSPYIAQFLVAIVFLGLASVAVGQDVKTFPAAMPSAQALKSCMESRNGAECMDQLFRVALKQHSTKEILQRLQSYQDNDPEIRRDCHPIVHAIGRETYRIKGTIHDSFDACDQTCHSGCYHGSVERFLRGENIYAEINKHPGTNELKQKAAIACDPKVVARFRFQCLHGLGHALLYFSSYKLMPSLEICDVLPED